MNVIYFCKRIVISKNSTEAKVVGAYWSCLFSQASGHGMQFRAIELLTFFGYVRAVGVLFAYISEPSGSNKSILGWKKNDFTFSLSKYKILHLFEKKETSIVIKSENFIVLSSTFK